MALNAVAQQPIDYYNSQAYRAHERGDKAEAAKCFLLYLQEPQRRGMTQAQQDSLYQADRRVYDQAAVNAIYLFYSVNDMDGVMKALPYGRRTSKGISNVYIAGMEACKEKGMNDLWMELLKEAIVRCPQNPQFSDRLIEYYQSNVEGEMINKLQEVGFSYDGIVLNAGAYTHTSVALHDCIRSLKTPVVEVHISNVFTREDFRHHSFLSPACKGVICGFGLDSYRLAVESFVN
jgi:3-dehydroquinate dehydratase-2